MAAYLEKKGFLEKLAENTFKKRKPLTLLVLTSLVSGEFRRSAIQFPSDTKLSTLKSHKFYSLIIPYLHIQFF